MPVRPLVAAALVAAAAIPVAAHAQLRVGDRVRVVARQPYGTTVGRFGGSERGLIRVVQEQTTAPLYVPRGSVVELDVAHPRSAAGGMAHGLLFGAGAGALGGVAVGAATGSTGRGAAIGAGGGALLGLVVGAMHPGTHWTRVEGGGIAGRMQLVPAARVAGRPGMELSLAF